MVLNMADLGKSWKSLETLWNASRTVLKLFVTALRDCVCRFKVNSQRSKFGRLGAKGLGYNPQVLNMADLGKSWKSLHTLWNASKPVLKWFVTDGATVCANLGWIGKGRKLADFDQNSWAIAHGFEHGRFWQVLEIARNSLKWLQNRSKMICDCLRDCLCRFRVNWQGSKIGRFWPKKAWATAHGFEHGRFWKVLKTAPNSQKRLLNRSKIICNCLRESLCRFRMNS